MAKIFFALIIIVLFASCLADSSSSSSSSSNESAKAKKKPAPLKCGKNEVINKCGVVCEGTCQEPQRACALICKNGPAVCQCAPGFVRGPKGKCIALSRCPKTNNCTGPNEHYVECGTCEGSCTDHNPICTEECRPSQCQCLEGFVRGPSGKCIAPSSCPSTDCSGPNEEYMECSGCEGTCSDPNPICTAVCRPPKCQCLQGFVRDGGRCIKPSACGNAPPDCATIQCIANSTCETGPDGRARCVPVCPGGCPNGQKCILKQVQCIRAPCPPIPECVPASAAED